MSQNETPKVNDPAQIYQKIAAVKKELGKLVKSANNPFFKSKYADLNTHIAAVEPLLEKQGLVLLQPNHALRGDGGNMVVTEVRDIETGASVQSSLALPPLTDMQKLGGAITYARRYTLGSLFAMQAEDDDGETAAGRSTTKKKKGTKLVAATEDF